jgi:hypothetical protein
MGEGDFIIYLRDRGKKKKVEYPGRGSFSAAAAVSSQCSYIPPLPPPPPPPSPP